MVPYLWPIQVCYLNWLTYVVIIIFQTQLCVSAYVCDIVMCQLGQQTQEIQSRDRQLSESAHQMASLRANGSAYVSNTGLCVTLLVGRQEGHPACKK